MAEQASSLGIDLVIFGNFLFYYIILSLIQYKLSAMVPYVIMVENNDFSRGGGGGGRYDSSI